MNDINSQSFMWIFPKKPVSLQFDPDNEIVLKQATLTQEVFYGKTWTGNVSEYWNIAGNWSPEGVPTYESISIPATAVRMPLIDDDGKSCGHMLIKPGATITISPGKKLTTWGTVNIE
jgi:hypothetical protein